MRHWAVVLFACISLYGVAAASQPAEISGAWKIDTHGGPTPLCSLVQVGSNLNGSCVGPQATGKVVGTVVGQSVHWRWQWVSYAGNSGAFEFKGIVRPDNTIAGMLERREIGLSLHFVAKKQILTTTGQTGGMDISTNSPEPGTTGETATVGVGNTPMQTSWAGTLQVHAAQTPASTTSMTRTPAANQYIDPRWAREATEYGMDPKLVQMSHDMFPFVSQNTQRLQWLEDQENRKADQRRGHSYYINVK